MNELRRLAARPAVRHLHLGLGNFFRAHQAWYTAHAPDGDQWGIAAFTGRGSTRSNAVVSALRAQDGLYTLGTLASDTDRFEVVGAIAAVHTAADHDAWLGYFANPLVQVVTTTVTEAGYVRAAGGGWTLTDPRFEPTWPLCAATAGPRSARRPPGWWPALRPAAAPGLAR